jgi:O-acetyl-ADP-ribose deacetylase (regulator of RNase III)
MALNPTPDFITQLKENEIFVFGSNLHGMHGGGAARVAHQKFGAEWGVGVGPTGRCYAIPTMHGGIDTIKPYVDDFITYAKEHTNQHFYVTRIGCGIAGFTDEQMAPLFKDLQELDNVSIPKQWADILGV